MIACTFINFDRKERMIVPESRMALDDLRQELSYLGCTDVKFILGGSGVKDASIPVRDSQGNSFNIRCSPQDIPKVMELFPDVYLDTRYKEGIGGDRLD